MITAMDDALLLTSRLLLLIAGAGGIVAVVVAAARRRVGVLPAIAIAMMLAQFASSWIAFDDWPTVVQYLLLLPWFLGFPVLAATFPDGRLVPRWSAVVLLGSLAVLVANLATGDALRNSGWWGIFPIAQMAFGVAFIIYRYRRSATTAEREAVRWVLLGVLVTLSCFMLIQVTDGVIGASDPLSAAKANLAIVPLMFGLVIGAAWPRVWNVDAAFRGVLVVLAVGWALGGVYAAVSAVVTVIAPATAALWSAAAVAAVAYPVIRLAMRGATWLVFRDRMDATAAVTALGAALDADDPRPVAQRVVDVAADATGSPSVVLVAAVEADAAVFGASFTAAGPPPDRPAGTEVPVALRGELLATLSAWPRRGESELSTRDREALAAIARHAAPALDGARALSDAHTANHALVTAREEERRRLRRELHDDLGPALSGLALGAAAIAKRAAGVDPAIAADARELQDDIGEAVARSREISHGLRPPVLDDLGLEAAIRARLGAGDDVVLEIGELGQLPAAVDLAALRIIQEAVANVRRHADASVCRVQVARHADGLRIAVSDDGSGMPRTVTPGLGLRSIRERASELGGRARVSAAPGGGTIVAVTLPISADVVPLERERAAVEAAS